MSTTFSTLFSLIKNVLSFLLFKNNSGLNNTQSQTKVILLFNTDSIRSIIGPKSRQELTTVSIPDSDPNERKISVKFNSSPQIDSTHHVIGQVDQNLFNFMTNILLSHPIQSLVILRREKPDIKKRIEKVAQIKSKKSTENEDIFTYAPSRAEREFLEERF